MKRRVVVTGLGMVSPVGNNVATSWNNAVAGKSGVARISNFDPSNLNVQIAAEVKNFNSTGIVEPKEATRMSRFCQFAAVVAKELLADANFNSEMSDPDMCGVSIGVGLGSLPDIEEATWGLRSIGQKKVSPFFIPYAIPNMAAGVVSRDNNFKGPNICVTTACASGTHSIGDAFMYVEKGLADVMIAGGAEASISTLGVASFANMKALSKNTDDPTTASRPFDLNRDGFVIGEGCGLILLEELEHAKKREAKIYAEIVGYGLSGDAHHITAPADNGEGGQRCMKMALQYAGCTQEDLQYINAHGTSTKLNDKYESYAISKIFGEHAPKISISSTKGVTGHCLGAAGGIEAVFTVLAIHNSLIPPTANYQTKDPECTLDYTVNGAVERPITYAMSNSFGFGGTNASIIFKKF